MLGLTARRDDASSEQEESAPALDACSDHLFSPPLLACPSHKLVSTRNSHHHILPLSLYCTALSLLLSFFSLAPSSSRAHTPPVLCGAVRHATHHSPTLSSLAVLLPGSPPSSFLFLLPPSSFLLPPSSFLLPPTVPSRRQPSLLPPPSRRRLPPSSSPSPDARRSVLLLPVATVLGYELPFAPRHRERNVFVLRVFGCGPLC